MQILGVDYGRKKIGLAISYEGKLAVPYRVLKISDPEEAVGEIERIVESERIKLLVLGVSEGKMADETREFGKLLEAKLKIELTLQDETLSTHEAESLAREAGKSKTKLQRSSDAYAAAIILQSYLNSN